MVVVLGGWTNTALRVPAVPLRASVLKAQLAPRLLSSAGSLSSSDGPEGPGHGLVVA